MNARVVLLIVLLAAVAGGVVLISSPSKGPAPVRPASSGSADGVAAQGTRPSTAGAPAAARDAFTKASDCRACHEAVYAEWQTSMHGRAWTDPMVQALSSGFRMTECIDCHAPMQIHVTGLAQRVAPRQHARGDGVDCLTCHLMEDGVSVAAVRDVDTSKVAGACRPVAVKEMAQADVCAGCHNQHQTVDELRQSGRPETCVDCHMPEAPRVAEGAGKTGHSHLWPGAHSVEMHQKAVTLDLAAEKGVVVARVTNVGAAHQVPTDARHRSYNLFVSAWDERGNPLVADRPMDKGEFRLYYRDDFRPSTQIANGKTGVATWTIPEGLTGTAKVRLVYALNPEELAAKRVTTVWEKEIHFP